MERSELIAIVSEKGYKWSKGQYLYCKVFCYDLNVTVDFVKGSEISLSSNCFLTIGNTCFYNIEAIWDIKFY